MKKNQITIAGFVLLAALGLPLSGCGETSSSDDHAHGPDTHEHGETGDDHVEGRGEHREEGGEHGEGEESGKRLAKSETWNATRNGALLVLAYNPDTESFQGTVQNVSPKPLSQVRVEVHLSNGVELGPTERTDLSPGDVVPVELSAAGQDFVWWTTHPEHGSEEGHGHEHEGEMGEDHGHSHDEVSLGTVMIDGMKIELAQGHGAIAAGQEGHLVVKLPYTDNGETTIRAWIGTEDRTMSYVGRGEYAPSHDDYDIHAMAPEPLPENTMWWIEIEKPDGTKLVGSAKPITE